MKLALLISTLVAALLGSACSNPIAGGYTQASTKDKDVIAAAKFAVTAQEAKSQKKDSDSSKTKLELIKIVKAREQVVAGTNYQLVLLVDDNGTTRTAKTGVWWQSWRTPDPYQLVSWEWQ